MVGWDILGDFCLVIKYEWVIERLDGKVIFLFFDMGCEQMLLLMKFFVFCLNQNICCVIVVLIYQFN